MANRLVAYRDTFGLLTGWNFNPPPPQMLMFISEVGIVKTGRNNKRVNLL